MSNGYFPYDLSEDELLQLRVLVPRHLQEGLRLYVERGLLPGSFLQCVLENDLFGALGKADLESRAGLHGLCSWIYSYAPSICHGSPKKVREWIAFHDERRRSDPPKSERPTP